MRAASLNSHFVLELLTLPPPFFAHLHSSFAPSSSGNPLQFPGDAGGDGEAELQRRGRRSGGLVGFPGGLPPLPHAVCWDGPSRVDGHPNRCSQGAPAQGAVQAEVLILVQIPNVCRPPDVPRLPSTPSL